MIVLEWNVSVVVRRMYYWDGSERGWGGAKSVSVVVRRMYYWDINSFVYLDNCTVSVVVRRMYYWDRSLPIGNTNLLTSFSSC